MRLTSLRFAICVLFFTAVLSAKGPPQVSQDPQDAGALATFKVRVWGELEPAIADFNSRVRGYYELRTALEQGLPPLVVTINPAEIELAERLLSQRIRTARAKAKRGHIFTPAIIVAIKKLLAAGMTRAAVADSRDNDDYPDEFEFEVNDTYPKERPLSTVPATVLALLPVLPADLEYRFVGSHLILRDTRANVIIDQLPDAVHLHGWRRR